MLGFTIHSCYGNFERDDFGTSVPFDWVPIKTALIAEELQKRGIATIANNTLVSVAAFDKWRSNIMFRSFVKAAKGIYIHHELFLAEKKNPGVSINVYKEYVFLSD